MGHAALPRQPSGNWQVCSFIGSTAAQAPSNARADCVGVNAMIPQECRRASAKFAAEIAGDEDTRIAPEAGSMAFTGSVALNQVRPNLLLGGSVG